ncbi:LysR family transcriptional regulator [Hyphococcus sp.]|uniref:LysR family transcriptional regulator n=1 Tax=Hyphococcus sp. TaxID=2038636 RepID=UPI003CCC281C
MRINDIDETNIRGLDLNLLRVFDAVIRLGSVSRAAEELGMTQPSTSGQISKLREALNDPLFVRESHGVAPTAFSENLYPYVRDALDTIERGLKDVREFDPHADNRTFTIIMTDIGETTILPSIIRAFSRFSPTISFRAINLPTHETPDALKSGLADLAIAYMPYLDVGFFQRKLFSTDYICLGRKGHPEMSKGVSMEAFRNADHVVAEARGTGHFYLLEQNFEALGIDRKIKVRVPNFMSIPHIVSGTDLLATVPRAFGLALKDGPTGICGHEHPIALPAIDVKMLWHERFHKDPAHRWLREQIYSVVQDIHWEESVEKFMGASKKRGKSRASVETASGEKEKRT